MYEVTLSDDKTTWFNTAWENRLEKFAPTRQAQINSKGPNLKRQCPFNCELESTCTTLPCLMTRPRVSCEKTGLKKLAGNCSHRFKPAVPVLSRLKL
jgi:hypothetical protein